VRGSALLPEHKKASSSFVAVEHDGHEHPNYADADGYETVTEWRCVDGCPVKALGEMSGELAGGGKSRSKSYKFTNVYGSGTLPPKPPEYDHPKGGPASRFFQQCDYALEQAEPFSYNAKASRTEREAGLLGHAPCLVCGGYDTLFHVGKTGKQEPCHRNGHPTQKPLSLAKYLSTLLLPPVEYAPRRILCPFFGTGSEGIGAHLAGFDEVLGIEMEPQYVEWARARVAHWCGASLPLFAMAEEAAE
jgi:hypothetical protein